MSSPVPVALPKVRGAAETLSIGSGNAPAGRMLETAATSTCRMARKLAYRASIAAANDSSKSGAGSDTRRSRGERPVAHTALTAMGNSPRTTLARLEY